MYAMRDNGAAHDVNYLAGKTEGNSLQRTPEALSTVLTAPARMSCVYIPDQAAE